MRLPGRADRGSRRLLPWRAYATGVNANIVVRDYSQRHSLDARTVHTFCNLGAKLAGVGCETGPRKKGYGAKPR